MVCINKTTPTTPVSSQSPSSPGSASPSRRSRTSRSKRLQMKRLRMKEYNNLKAIVPSLANKTSVSKVAVVEEAIKYIDELQAALAQRLCALDEMSLRATEDTPLPALQPVPQPGHNSSDLNLQQHHFRFSHMAISPNNALPSVSRAQVHHLRIKSFLSKAQSVAMDTNM